MSWPTSPDLEHVVALRLRHEEPLALVGDERRRGHPVERLVAAGVVVDEHGTVRFQNQEAHGFREDGRDAAGVDDLAAGDDETHRRNLLSRSDRSAKPRRRIVRHG